MASILITILQLRSGEERSDPGLAVRVRRTTSITSLQLRSGGGGGGEKEEAHAGGTADIKSNTSQPGGEQVLEFKLCPSYFERVCGEWQTLKARCERQAGATLPDNILVATLLNRTTGPLQQHLRLNVRTMDSYDTVKDCERCDYCILPIETYYELVGALWCKGGRGKMGPHWKGST